MLTKSQRKTKAYSIAAIMDNENLSKLFNEALSSSLGSTKRQKARKILKTLTNIQGSYINDGRGGGMDYRSFKTENYLNQNQPDVSVLNPVNNASQPQVNPATMDGVGQNGVESTPYIFNAAPATKTPSDIAGYSATDSSTSNINNYLKGLGTTEVEEYEVPEDLRAQYPSVFEAVEAGIGANTFAQQVLSDKEKLKEILPGIPEEELPVGASLTQQLGELETTLKEEHNVNQLRNKVKQLEEEGMTITDDLENYMTARDEYITKVDGMIENAKDSVLKMDLANPHISKMANQYLEYLYLLKGRQQKRYADFLDDSITYHNNNLTRAQNAYETAYNNFYEEYNKKGALTEERYNNLKTMLQDLYSNVANREAEFYQIGTARENYIQAQLETAATALEPLGLSERINFSQWAVEAGIAGRTENQVYDIMNSDLPPDWFKEELLAQKQSSYSTVPIDQYDSIALERYKAGGVKELGVFLSGLSEMNKANTLTDEETLSAWNELKERLSSSSSRATEMENARQLITQNIGKISQRTGKPFTENPAEIYNIIRANTSELSQGDIESIMAEFGFIKSYGLWTYLGSVVGPLSEPLSSG